MSLSITLQPLDEPSSNVDHFNGNLNLHELFVSYQLYIFIIMCICIGYMIMAFDKSSPVAAIGSFQVSDDRLSHTIDCHGGFEVNT